MSRISIKEQEQIDRFNKWIDAWNSLKLKKLLFGHECYKCGDAVYGEKMWREYVFVGGDWTSSGGYSYFYVCTKCAPKKKDAFIIFQGEEAYYYIINGKERKRCYS